jgi:hypothetical protein
VCVCVFNIFEVMNDLIKYLKKEKNYGVPST